MKRVLKFIRIIFLIIVIVIVVLFLIAANMQKAPREYWKNIKSEFPIEKNIINLEGMKLIRKNMMHLVMRKIRLLIIL